MTDTNQQNRWKLEKNVNISHIVGILGMGGATVSWLLFATLAGFSWTKEIMLRINNNERLLQSQIAVRAALSNEFTRRLDGLEGHLWRMDEKLDRLAEERP